MATLEQIAAALRKADAAGNVEDARALANAYRQMQGQATQAPAAPKTGQQLADEMNLPVPGMMSADPPSKYQPSAVPWLDPINAFANSAVDSIPIAGPTLTNMGQNADAVFNSLITGEPYDFDKSWQERAFINAAEQSEFPAQSVAGGVAGSVAPLLALGMTKPGGQALGLEGPVGQRMVAGGISGGLIAGADQYARTGDVDAAVDSGRWGLALGSMFPLAERAINPIARMLFGQNVPQSTQNINRSLERAGIDPATIPQRMDALGPDAMMLDLDRNLTRQAGGIASLPGKGSTVLDEALTARHGKTNARIQAETDDILGAAPIPSRVAAGIDANRKALSPYYDQVLDGARAVETDGIALNLDSMIVDERGAAQAAARQVRQMLNVTGESVLDPNPRTLLNTRHAIDGILYTDGALAPLDSNVKRVLQQARRDIDAELAAKVPGIKEVDARYSELAGQGKAITDGQTLLDSGRAQVTRPAELDDMLAPQMSIVGPSGVPFRLSQGTRAEIDRLIGTTGNDITALKGALKGDGSWNRQKLASLYGEDKADRLIGLLEREQRYTDSFNRITQNSETAARNAAQQEAAPHVFGNTSTSLADLLLKIPQGVANAGARSRSESVNAAIAEMLTGRPSPEMVDQLLAARRMNRGLIGSAPVPYLTNQ